MTATVRDFSISVRSAASYTRTVLELRAALKHHGLEVLHEFAVEREVSRQTGIDWTQLGLRWRHYTVLVVWSPSDSCPALLSDRDAGLLIPFNVCVVEDESSTFVAMPNPYAALTRSSGSIGIQTLVRDLARKIRQVLVEVAAPEDGTASACMAGHEAYGF